MEGNVEEISATKKKTTHSMYQRSLSNAQTHAFTFNSNNEFSESINRLANNSSFFRYFGNTLEMNARLHHLACSNVLSPLYMFYIKKLELCEQSNDSALHLYRIYEYETGVTIVVADAVAFVPC